MYSDPRKQINRSRRKNFPCFSTFCDQIQGLDPDLDSPGSGIFSVRIRNTDCYLRFVYVSFHVSTDLNWMFFLLTESPGDRSIGPYERQAPYWLWGSGKLGRSLHGAGKCGTLSYFFITLKLSMFVHFLVSSLYRYFSVFRFSSSSAWISKSQTCRVRAPVPWHIANLSGLPISDIGTVNAYDDDSKLKNISISTKVPNSASFIPLIKLRLSPL